MKGKFTVFSLVAFAVLFILTVGLTQAQEPPLPQGVASPESSLGSVASTPLSTGFTYQGRLQRGGAPFDGACDMAFRLYDAASAGSELGAITTTVPISSGLFTVNLDFGTGVFTGSARWLGIKVKCLSDSVYTDLGRQELTAAPQAFYALSTGALQGRAVLTVTPTLSQVLKWNGSAWAPAVDETGGGGGASWSLTGNAGTNPSMNFLGTTDNVSLTLRVSNTVGLRLAPGGGTPNVIGGYEGNIISDSVEGAVIAGGGAWWGLNRITGNYASIGGGADNQATDSGATVGGGWNNQASAYWATVGGGYSNQASGYTATVCGGAYNQASGDWAAVGGGYSNLVTGAYSTIAGGYNIIATGDFAFVGGGFRNTVGHVATVGGGDTNTASGSRATVGGGVRNTASGAGAFVGGGGYDGFTPSGNQASGTASTIGGGYSNLVTATYGTIVGGYDNTASGAGAFVGGGGTDGRNYSGNQASGAASTIGGGMSNLVTGTYDTIAGGYDNTAGGMYATVSGGTLNAASDYVATVGGGWDNTASNDYAAVGGGVGNTASGYATTVGGGHGNTASGDRATVGGGRDNTASGAYAMVGGGEGNQAIFDYATVGGGRYNQATGYQATVGGGRDNRATNDTTTVGGGYFNQATGDRATVSGGGGNEATGDLATVGGGGGNKAMDWWTTIGGGRENQATGQQATIGGGYSNQTAADYATVGGGYKNQITGTYATVGGGGSNQAVGWAATVPGGAGNWAQGGFSFAAGENAKANHDGAFVWGDGTAADIHSSGNNQFIVRANGGIWFGRATGNLTPTIGAGVFISTSTGGYLTVGGAWTNASDRNLKVNFNPVDGEEVLARLAKIPISTWNYRTEDASIRHIGPTAQDFRATFGLGYNDTSISTVDADGVALAAAQGLYDLSQEQAARIQELETHNVAQQAQIDALEARLTALEGNNPASSHSASALFWTGVGIALALAGMAVALVVRRKGGTR